MESMPISLLVAWVLMKGFVNTHQRHAANFRGASLQFQAALHISSMLGMLAGVGLLIFYFTKAAWYYPIMLFVIGMVGGGAVFGLLDVAAERAAQQIFKTGSQGIGQMIMSPLGFVGWPLSAIWSFSLMQGISA